MNSKIRKIWSIAVMVCLVISMAAASHAAVHDPAEDKSSETATLILGKDLTYINRQMNPLTKVTYRIEKVSGWQNENASARENGTDIPVSEMPDPSLSSVDIHLTDDGDGKASGKEEVTITFDKAGYYMYRITEIPITVDGAEAESDTHSYFAVIYVCNSTDEDGNTVPGVYVHDITSYRNESSSSAYEPDLSDIANVTDNGGQAALENDEENLGKTGKSSPDHPDVLEAYKMWNTVTYPDPVDFTVTNNVTGSLGDTTKEFEFSFLITGAEPGASYEVTGDGVITGGRGTAVTADEEGKIELQATMKDDQSLTITDLPKGSVWTVTEGASNHKASYSVDPTENAVEAEKANPKDEMEITSEGTLDSDSQADFVNERNIAVMTGVGSDSSTVMMALMLAVLIISMTVIRRRVMR